MEHTLLSPTLNNIVKREDKPAIANCLLIKTTLKPAIKNYKKCKQ